MIEYGTAQSSKNGGIWQLSDDRKHAYDQMIARDIFIKQVEDAVINGQWCRNGRNVTAKACHYW